MLYASKQLQDTNLFQEYQQLINKYYHTSLQKEYDQNQFLQKMDLINTNTGEIAKIFHSFEKYYTKYTKSNEQKIYAIEALAKSKGYKAVFITLTLPTIFHPFKSIAYKNQRLYTNINEAFSFDSIEDSIKHGYHFLNHIYRTLYKRIKTEVKNLYYVKVIETHKTLIPHLHVVFFVPTSKKKIIFEKFSKIVTEFELDQYDYSTQQIESLENEPSTTIKTKIGRASKYLLKYVLKSLNAENIFWIRVLDGYKRDNRMRIITSSNLPLSMADYRAIYHNLDSELKDKLLKEAKKEGINLFYLILKNIAIVSTTKEQGQIIKQKKYQQLLKQKFVLIKQVIRRRRNELLSYSVNKLTFFINRQIIYKKDNYIRRLQEVML